MIFAAGRRQLAGLGLSVLVTVYPVAVLLRPGEVPMTGPALTQFLALLVVLGLREPLVRCISAVHDARADGSAPLDQFFAPIEWPTCRLLRRLRVEAGAVRHRVLLRVVDAGPEFPPTERQQAFELFHRPEDRRPHEGEGVGVGLAVARGCTRAIGADLTVEDTHDGRTTMVVDLAKAP